MLGNLGRNQEQRSISYQKIWGSGADFVSSAESGVPIDQSNAFKLNAFYACVLLISDTISTLPVDCFIRRDGDRYPFRPQPAWVQKPDVDMLRAEHYQQVLVSMLLDGNAFTRIYRDANGDVANLVVLDPIGLLAQRDSMLRWTQAWEMKNAAGVKIETPWGYGSSRGAEDEFLIIANELYDLPPTYKRLDWGRNLQTTTAQHQHTVPEYHGTVEGTYDVPSIIVDGEPQKGIGYRSMTKSWLAPGDGEGIQITGSFNPGDATEEGGNFQIDVGDIATAGDPAVAVDSTQAIPGELTRLTNGSITYDTGSFVFDGTTRTGDGQPNITTTQEGGLIGGPNPEVEGEFLPVATTTVETFDIIEREHNAVTYALSSGEPSEPYNGSERTIPIPYCSTTGINFDIYLS